MSLLNATTMSGTPISAQTLTRLTDQSHSTTIRQRSSESARDLHSTRWTPYPSSKPSSEPSISNTNKESDSTQHMLSTDFITNINKAANSITGIGNPNVKNPRIRAAKLYVANAIWEQAYCKPTSDIEIDIETQQSISNRITFSETEPNEGDRFGECGEEHRMHVLCAACEEEWKGWSFEELQEGRLGYLRDGSRRKKPDVLVRFGDD